MVAGCGGSSGATVTTEDPATAFAPLIQLHPDERYMPMSARWFLSRSALILAEDQGCDDRKIAVGRLLKSQRNAVTDWLFITGIGWGPTYWRQAYKDGRCDLYRERYRYYANQLTRPHDDDPDRAPGLRPGEGYYLDLMDWGRSGPPASDDGGQATVASAQAWFERERTQVGGQPGLRLTYWLLFGMNEARDESGEALADASHEGDWERVEVLLQGEGGEWSPVAVRLPDENGRDGREIAWEDLRRVGDDRTHPVLFAAQGTHTLYARPGTYVRNVDLAGGRSVRARDVATAACSRCPRWATWRRLTAARKVAWYGFGGAWGEVGRTSATTGPLGPHGEWAKGDPADDLARSKRRP